MIAGSLRPVAPYTAITRGKRLVVLVGSKRALAIDVKNNQTKPSVSAGIRPPLQRKALTKLRSQAI
jgi:ATP-dependent exoDNAse (exonuclease V) alpha subunit